MSDANDSCEGDRNTIKEPNTGLNNAFVMIESQELNDSERDIMKGDTVGDTVYSARWIINTLKSLSQINDEDFTPNVETDLCMLWDMTADKDVVIFLLKFDFLELIYHILKTTSTPRLTEILLGIIGNLCCFNEALQSLEEKKELVSTIFNYLTDSDTETLLQVIRIVKCFMWDIQSNESSTWKEKCDSCQMFGQCLAFILASSKNEQLLTATLDLVELITTISSEDERLIEKWFDLGQLIIAIFECFDQLFSSSFQNTEENLNRLKNWITIYHYIVNSETFKRNPEFEKETVYSNTTKVLEQILKIFPLGYTIPMKDVPVFCIGTSIDIMMWFLKNRGYYETDVIALVPSFLIAMKTDMESTAIDKEELSQEQDLIDYLHKSWFYIKNSLDRRNLFTIKMVCENILKSEREMTHDNLHELTQSLKISDQ